GGVARRHPGRRPTTARWARRWGARPGPASARPQEEPEERDDADQHRERVVHDEARLVLPEPEGPPAEERGHAVHGAVDQAEIEDLGRPATEPEERLDEHPIVQLVDVVLPEEEPVDAVPGHPDPGQGRGPPEIHPPR